MAGRYADEFKRNAVQLAGTLGVAETAKKLGVHINTLYEWQLKAKRGAGPKPGAAKVSRPTTAKKTVSPAPVAAKTLAIADAAPGAAKTVTAAPVATSFGRAAAMILQLKRMDDALSVLRERILNGTVTENDVKNFVVEAAPPFDFLRESF
jgi:transposase-like protein